MSSIHNHGRFRILLPQNSRIPTVTPPKINKIGIVKFPAALALPSSWAKRVPAATGCLSTSSDSGSPVISGCVISAEETAVAEPGGKVSVLVAPGDGVKLVVGDGRGVSVGNRVAVEVGDGAIVTVGGGGTTGGKSPGGSPPSRAWTR